VGYGVDDGYGHGTRMCDAVGGSYAGSAKDTQVISVKFTYRGGSVSGAEPDRLEALTRAFNEVIHDVRTHSRAGRAIISFSHSMKFHVLN